MKTIWIAVVLTGCASTTPSPIAPPTGAPAAKAVASASPLKTPGEARLGDRTTCLVSGEEFLVRETSPRVDYQGKTYYFCCAGCDTAFKKNPEKFLHNTH